MNDGRTYNMHQCEDVVPDAFPMVAHHGTVHHDEHLAVIVKNIIVTIMIVCVGLQTLEVTETPPHTPPPSLSAKAAL